LPASLHPQGSWTHLNSYPSLTPTTSVLIPTLTPNTYPSSYHLPTLILTAYLNSYPSSNSYHLISIPTLAPTTSVLIPIPRCRQLSLYTHEVGVGVGVPGSRSYPIGRVGSLPNFYPRSYLCPYPWGLPFVPLPIPTLGPIPYLTLPDPTLSYLAWFGLVDWLGFLSFVLPPCPDSQPRPYHHLFPNLILFSSEFVFLFCWLLLLFLVIFHFFHL